MQSTGLQVELLSGDDFRRLIAAATHCLEQNAEAINALNVFPVPDGDTGVNMLLTMRSLEERAASLPPGSALADVAQAMARGALLGARGNSGVILSQFFRGLAKGFAGCEHCSRQEMALAFQEAARFAYKAVGKPVEGTMLTVIRAATDAAAEASRNHTSLTTLWQAARDAAVHALARTPEQLPVLREAGVVDAGGQGVVALLEGGLAYLLGAQVPELAITAPEGVSRVTPGQVSAEYLAATEETLYGYCTSFMVSGQKLDVDAIRDRMAAAANSVVVVGDDSLVKVHVHTFDPGPVISYAVSVGALSQVKIDNIDEQHLEFVAIRRRGKEVPVAVVAVASGSGLENVFRNLGATVVVRGGQTMNPSAQELLDAVQQAGARDVLVLPNNPNITLAATQAARLSRRRIHVVPTRSIPQGIAALLAFNPEQDAQANVTSMSRGMGEVRSGEVTTAIRTSTVDGRHVREGQGIGFLEGELGSVADTPEEALVLLLDQASPVPGALITLYWGGDLDQQQAEEVAQCVKERLTGVEVELVQGGQPFYHFILSIE